jgi:ABC-type Fe3+-hydroxamate transport system substrate-binding protein
VKQFYQIMSVSIMIATLIFIGAVRAEWISAQALTEEAPQKDDVNQSQKKNLEDGQGRNPFFLPPGVCLLSKTHTSWVSKETESKMETYPLDLSPQRVRAILISEHIRLALIDRHIVTVGDKIKDEKILEIKKDHVILGKGDKKRTLLLSQSPLRLTVEEN